MALKYLNFTGLTDLVTNIMNWVTSRIPTKTSEIDNDSGYITASDLPTNHVTTNTAQTITSTKTIQNAEINLKQTGITLGTTPSSNQYKRVQSVDNSNTAFAQLVYVQRNDGNTYIELRAGDKFTSGAKATDGTQVWSDFQVGTSPDGNKYIYTDARWSNSLIPYTNNASSLGDATHRWTNVYGTVRLDPANNATADLLYSKVGSNDYFRLQVGGASNAGWVELATADDGNEPIYVRQYTGVFTTLKRTLTLLDGSGNTTLPGTLNAVSYQLNGTAFGDIVTHNASEFLTSHQSLSNYATKTYVDTSVANLVNSAPTTLDTLNELATALGNDPNFATTVATSIGTKANDSDVVHLAGTETITGSKTFNSPINSPYNSSTWLNANNGGAIINSTATAGTWTCIAKTNSANGHFTLGSHVANFYLNYTVGTETGNRTTKSVKLLDESGNSYFPGIIESGYVFGDGKAAFRAHINTATSTWSYGISILNGAMSANQYIFCPIGKAYSTANCAGLRFQWVGNSSNDNNIGFEFYGTGSPLVIYKDGRATLSVSPDASDNSTRIATTAYVKSQGYLTAHQSLANYVTLNSDQTISSSKRFAAQQYRYNTSYDAGQNTSIADFGFSWVDKDLETVAWINRCHWSNNYSGLSLGTRNKYTNNALATNGTAVDSYIEICTTPTGVPYLNTNAKWWCSVSPANNNSVDLGTSTNKWRSAYVCEYHAYNQNAFMAKNGNYTFLIRNDGTATYFLMSESGGNEGTWSSARPLTITNSTGVCNINGNSATATQFSANKNVTLTGAIMGTVSSKAGWSVPTSLKFSWNATGGTVTNTYFKLASGEVDGGWNRYEAYVKITNVCTSYASCILRIFIMINNSGLCDSCTVTICELKGWTTPPVSVIYKNSTNSTLFEIYGQITSKNHQFNCIVLSETSRTINTTLHPDGPSSVLVMHSGGTPVAALPDDYTVVTPTLENYTANTFYGNLSGNVTGNCSGSSGSCTGNAATATEFSANTTVALTGDATGTSAGSKKGWSVPVTLANSGVTAGTYGPSANVTGNNNATIAVPEITVDAKGRVTSVTNRTLTCKNNTYNVYNKTLTIQKNGTNVATFTSNSNTDVTANITVPTKTSELTNDSNFVTTSDVANAVSAISVSTNATTLSYFVINQTKLDGSTSTTGFYVDPEICLPTVGVSNSYDIDTTNWDVSGTGIHVTVKDANNITVPGYVMIYLSKCAATDYVTIQLTSMARSAGIYVPPIKSGSNYYVKACFPTSGDFYVNIVKTAGTIGYAKLYPFVGNFGYVYPS